MPTPHRSPLLRSAALTAAAAAVPLAGRAGGSLVSPVGLERSRFRAPRKMSRSPANRQVSLRKLPVVNTAPDTTTRIPRGARRTPPPPAGSTPG